MPTFKPKGYKDLDAAQKLIDSAPKDSDFNPYDYIDQSYYKNNARGRMAYQEDLAKLLYMAQINQEERMNEYNSPEEQAKRMREAGLNPDLLGVSGEPAANVAGYQGNPMDGTQSTMQNVSDIFGIVSSTINIVSSIASGVGSIFNSSSVIDTMNSAVSLFENMPTSLDVPSFINNSLLSRRQKRKINALHNSYTNSLHGSTRGYNEQTDNMIAKGTFYKYFNNPLYNQGIFDDYQEEQLAFARVWQPLIDAENELLLNELKGKNAIALFNSSRYSKELGETEKEFYDTKYKLYQHLRGPINETLANLKKLDNKYPWAVYARGAVSALFLHAIGGLD